MTLGAGVDGIVVVVVGEAWGGQEDLDVAAVAATGATAHLVAGVARDVREGTSGDLGGIVVVVGHLVGLHGLQTAVPDPNRVQPNQRGQQGLYTLCTKNAGVKASRGGL